MNFRRLTLRYVCRCIDRIHLNRFKIGSFYLTKRMKIAVVPVSISSTTFAVEPVQGVRTSLLAPQNYFT